MSSSFSSPPPDPSLKLNSDLQQQLPKPSNMQNRKTTLQQHAAFFDRNGDGIIYPWETFQGLRAIGCGLAESLLGSVLIHLFLSYPTQPGWLPSPLLSIHINNIHKGKHGSDSESYDTEGRFYPSKFDDIFSKYGRTHPNALTRDELSSMLYGNRNTYDFPGWMASAGEWFVLYNLAKDKDGLLQRETVRGVFDGSLFKRLQNNNYKKKSS